MKNLVSIILIILFTCSFSFSQWTLQGTVTGLGLYPSISVYSPTGVVIAGGLQSTPTAKVYKSTNNGINWTDISGDLIQRRLYALWALNENIIFVGNAGASGNGGDAQLFKTTNGGINWTLVLSTGGTMGYFNDIVFSRTNPLIGIAQSDPPTSGGNHFLAKTTDGGVNWIVQNTISTSSAAITHSAICIDNLFYGWGIAGAYGTKSYLMTTNGGTNWFTKAVNLPGNDFYVSGFAFSSDKSTGIASSSTTLPNISRSTDGGNNWVTINTGLPISGESKMKWVYNTNCCYLVSDSGSSGCVGKSTNGGLNWILMNTAGVIRLNHIDVINVGGIAYVYAISKNGSVI